MHSRATQSLDQQSSAAERTSCHRNGRETAHLRSMIHAGTRDSSRCCCCRCCLWCRERGWRGSRGRLVLAHAASGFCPLSLRLPPQSVGDAHESLNPCVNPPDAHTLLAMGAEIASSQRVMRGAGRTGRERRTTHGIRGSGSRRRRWWRLGLRLRRGFAIRKLTIQKK